MSYLKDLGAVLAEKLSALPEEERHEFIAFVKETVLTSYKNGLRDGATPRPPKKGEPTASRRDRRDRPAPRGKRSYHKR